MSPTDVLWLAALAAGIHVLLGALQAGSFNAALATFSLPPINAKAFPWLGLLLGLGAGVVDGVQHGMAVSSALATSVVTMITGGASALHLETIRGALPANTPGAGGSLQVVAVQKVSVPPVAVPAVKRTGFGKHSVTWAAGVLAAICAIVVIPETSLTGCAQIASLVPADVKSIEEKILADMNAGMTLDQIVADVGKGVTGDALQIVYDYVASLLDSALLSESQRTTLGAMRVEAVQKIAMRSGARAIDAVTK
jgi:hypothetical protein